ncbi:MAG: MmgE/PrpD family protein, partial [Actinomycetota bacterium]|nr:MmgE/PrpD family protein [Actinomycetota bacterium]
MPGDERTPRDRAARLARLRGPGKLTTVRAGGSQRRSRPARVAAAGAAGHVLDLDDTYQPGLAHLSAPTAPAALVLGAERGASIADVLDAYAAGFEAMGVLTRACHPGLYDGGWHPTAVCGTAGAAVAAARLHGLDCDRQRAAIGLALLRVSGLRAAFGSDGKALQVGMAAAAGRARELDQGLPVLLADPRRDRRRARRRSRRGARRTDHRHRPSAVAPSGGARRRDGRLAGEV